MTKDWLLDGAGAKEPACQRRRRKRREFHLWKDQEDPLEEGMATDSRILAWRPSWTEETDGLQSMGPQSQTLLK